MTIIVAIVLVAAAGFITYLAFDAIHKSYWQFNQVAGRIRR